MLRFLHTADWQIGKPYLRVPDPQKRFRLQEERIRAIGRIREAVRERQARFVLVAGDLFDSPTVPPPVVLEVLEAIGAIGVPVLVIPGNHDHGAPGSVWHRDDFGRERERRAPNLRLLLKRETLELDDLVVLPCPLLRQADSTDPTAWIGGLDLAALPADRPRIVLAHGSVQGFGARDYDADEEARAGANNRLDLSRLPEADIDYIALGDWHNLRQVSERAWYPGTPEPDRFDQGEGNQRGQVLQVDVRRGGLPRVEVIPTGRLGWHSLRFRFSADADLDRLEAQLRTLIGDRVSTDLLRLEVSGSLSLAAHRRYERLIEDLRHQLLRLRLRDSCEQAPRAEELEALVSRPLDPLIARVAAALQQRLEEEEEKQSPLEATGADSETTRLTRVALCELFQIVTSH